MVSDVTGLFKFFTFVYKAQRHIGILELRSMIQDPGHNKLNTGSWTQDQNSGNLNVTSAAKQ